MHFFEYYQQAGRIASIVREKTRNKYHVGDTLFQICESIEDDIIMKGGSPAFPVNVSLNDIAASLYRRTQRSNYCERWRCFKD